MASVSADGAYDTEGPYEVAHAQGKGRALRVHPTSTRRSAESKADSRIEGEESEHPLHPQTRSTRMAQAIGLQQAQHG